MIAERPCSRGSQNELIPGRRFGTVMMRRLRCPGGASTFSSPDREPLRAKIPDLPDVFVVSVESDNTGRVVNRCREAGIQRSEMAGRYWLPNGSGRSW